MESLHISSGEATVNGLKRMQKEDFEILFQHSKTTGNAEWEGNDYYELLFFRKGDMIYTIGETQHELVSGDILMIPPDVPLSVEFYGEQPYKRIQLRLSRKFMEEMDPDQELRRIFYLSDSSGKPDYLLRENTSRIVSMVETLFHEVMSDKVFMHRMAMMQITRVVIMIYRDKLGAYSAGGVAASGQQALVMRAAKYINDHITQDLSLDALAEQLFISKYHLSRLFRQYMKISIHQYITQHRLIMARRMINEGKPLQEVGLQCGFANYSTFYRAFEKYFGCSPRDFAKWESFSGATDAEMEY